MVKIAHIFKGDTARLLTVPSSTSIGERSCKYGNVPKKHLENMTKCHKDGEKTRIYYEKLPVEF